MSVALLTVYILVFFVASTYRVLIPLAHFLISRVFNRWRHHFLEHSCYSEILLFHHDLKYTFDLPLHHYLGRLGFNSRSFSVTG